MDAEAGIWVRCMVNWIQSPSGFQCIWHMIRDIHIRYGSMTDLFLLRANSATWQACTWQASCWQESIWQESSKSKAHMSKISLMMFLFIKFHCIPNDCEAERGFFFRGRRALHFGEEEEEDRRGQRSRWSKPMLPGRDCGRNTAGTSTGTSFATSVEERLHILILKIDFWVALIWMERLSMYVYIYGYTCTHTRIYIYNACI